MPSKEAKASFKINNLLQDSGWRLIDNSTGKANVVLENNVKITRTISDGLGEDFEKTINGFLYYLWVQLYFLKELQLLLQIRKELPE